MWHQSVVTPAAFPPAVVYNMQSPPYHPISRSPLMRRTHTLTSDASPTMTPMGSFEEVSPTNSRKSSLATTIGGDGFELPAITLPIDEHLLQVPVDPNAMLHAERPPHRQDTIERIPMRARSQSWLIRTRHLIGKHHVSGGGGYFLVLIPDAFRRRHPSSRIVCSHCRCCC